MPYQDQSVGSSRPEKARAEAEIKNAPSMLSFPAKPYPHSMLMVFKKYDFKNYEAGNYSSPLRNAGVGSTGRTTGQELRSTDSIELPFPKELSDNTGLNINGYSRDPLVEKGAQKINEYINSGGSSTLGDIPGAIQRAGGGLASMLSGASSTGGGAFGAAKELYASLTGTSVADAAQGAKYLMRNLASGSVGQAIDTATGQTLNPKETLAFEGVQLRTHQFNWELFPSNQQDSENIRKIISMIKRNALPTKENFGGIANAFLNFPSVVELHLIGVNKNYYPIFKPAMITSVSVDYQAGGSSAILRGGKPAGVTLNIALTELEIQTAEDMDLGDSSNWTDSNGEFMGP